MMIHMNVHYGTRVEVHADMHSHTTSSAHNSGAAGTLEDSSSSTRSTIPQRLTHSKHSHRSSTPHDPAAEHTTHKEPCSPQIR